MNVPGCVICFCETVKYRQNMCMRLLGACALFQLPVFVVMLV